MKKSYLLMAAASALMLTACSGENDLLQNTTQQQQSESKAIGFDVYTPAPTSVTRAGQAGTMTTGRLQRTDANHGGFGVYAYLVEDEDAAVDATSYITWSRDAATKKAPNFMVNEKVLWNAVNQGWYYNPLKYWPNETNNDSQTTPAWMEDIEETAKHLDRLTFFAYAPYVATGVNEPGITYLTNKNGIMHRNPESDVSTGTVVEASVGYKASLDDPSKAVDLLWGVAPAGGLSYTAVNKEPVYVGEGEPLVDMTKPDVNTTMKFLFQHALARIGINVVAAIDQVGAGGTLDPNTKITVNEVTLTGMFGETGDLNLDNPTPSVANWVKINGTAVNDANTAVATPTTLTLNVANGTIAPDLCYEGDHTPGSYAAQPVSGVTTTKKDLMAGRYYALDAVPAYTPSKDYYSNENGTVAVAKYNAQATDNYFTKTDVGPVYNQVTGNITPAGSYYTVVAGATVYNGNHELTAAVNYTQEEANTHNATLPGARKTTDVKNAAVYTAVTSGTTLTSGNTYYTSGAGAGEFVSDGSQVADGTNYYELTSAAEYYSADECNTHNATLPGAVSTSSIKTPATYGYNDTDLPSGTVLYTRSGDEGAYIYTYVGTKSDITTSPGWGVGNTNTYYTITPTALAVTDIAFEYSGTIYDVERNYFMVVPTNNFLYKNSNIAANSDEDKALRTVRVKIEYYITTEDAKVAGGRTQTKNVIEKDVVFPSMANGKSYMLNLVLGLTSVKMEAEVDDWKVINVQADLPQNTAE